MGKEMSFAPAELYVLAGAAGVTDIFGLPNRDAIILLDAECVTKATTSLKEKGLLTSENGITPAAFQIIELLKEYENCHEYTRMNNVLIGFLKEDKDRVAVLTEIEPNKNTRSTTYQNRTYIFIINTHSFLIERTEGNRRYIFLKENDRGRTTNI